MGNCFMRQRSSRALPGDDWGPMSPEHHATSIERQRLLGEEKGGFSHNPIGSSGPAITEVKIKVSKRELEELMGRIEIQGLSMEQVLNRLVKSGKVSRIGLIDHHHHHHHHRSWKPALQSIPEVN